MTPITTFAGRTLALFGLGGSGLATARALVAGGAKVVACDDDPARMEAAAAEGIGTGDLRAADWSGVSALVLAPGVPLTHPAPHWTVVLAKAAAVPVIGDIELFCRERAAIAPNAPFVAITGTNGKSTTTALVAHLLRAAGRDAQMGGNIGTAILSLAPPHPDRVHVIEMSSFQIDLTPSLRPSVGLLLNITPDHLDRHGTMADYAGIKERLVADADTAVVGIDDDYCRAIAGRRAGRRAGPLVRIHVAGDGEPSPAGALTVEGSLIRDEAGAVIADLSGIGTLRGAHNGQNAAMALAALRALGLPPASLAEGLRRFPGLAHRMEPLGHHGKVLFVNDSKATNADSAERALSAFRDIHWILGGKAKEGGIIGLVPWFARVTHAYLIGAASDEFAGTLAAGGVPFTRCGTLEAATETAAAAAARSNASEPVVLLSPACASYDQFRSFEHRGERFRELVRALG